MDRNGMVGEAARRYSPDFNSLPESAGKFGPLIRKGDFQRLPHPPSPGRRQPAPSPWREAKQMGPQVATWCAPQPALVTNRKDGDRARGRFLGGQGGKPDDQACVPS